MKNFKIISLVALIGLSILSSCSKNDSQKKEKPAISAHAKQVATWSGTWYGKPAKVTYEVGEEEVITTYGSGFAYHTRKTGNCWGFYGFCKPISVTLGSPVVGSDKKDRLAILPACPTL